MLPFFGEDVLHMSEHSYVPLTYLKVRRDRDA